MYQCKPGDICIRLEREIEKDIFLRFCRAVGFSRTSSASKDVWCCSLNGSGLLLLICFSRSMLAIWFLILSIFFPHGHACIGGPRGPEP